MANLVTRWRTSSYSGENGGTDCVEVDFRPRAAAIRDSKNASGPQLAFTAQDWRAFVRATR